MDSFAEYDDDVYYADLERQILTLMGDDEDDSNVSSPATASASPLFHQQMASNVGSPTCSVWSSPPAIIEDWSRPHAHSWKLPIRENSAGPAGTGVFIPQTHEKTKEDKRGKTYKDVPISNQMAREYIPTEISDPEMAQGRTSKKLF